jgi:hypothetical protein
MLAGDAKRSAAASGGIVSSASAQQVNASAMPCSAARGELALVGATADNKQCAFEMPLAATAATSGCLFACDEAADRDDRERVRRQPNAVGGTRSCEGAIDAKRYQFHFAFDAINSRTLSRVFFDCAITVSARRSIRWIGGATSRAGAATSSCWGRKDRRREPTGRWALGSDPHPLAAGPSARRNAFTMSNDARLSCVQRARRPADTRTWKGSLRCRALAKESRNADDTRRNRPTRQAGFPRARSAQ